MNTIKKKKLYTFKEGGASIKGFYLQVMFHCLMIKKTSDNTDKTFPKKRVLPTFFKYILIREEVYRNGVIVFAYA